jgi:hypothetical protein
MSYFYGSYHPFLMKANNTNIRKPAKFKTTLTNVKKTTHQNSTRKNHPTYNNSQQHQEYKKTGAAKITRTSTKI